MRISSGHIDREADPASIHAIDATRVSSARAALEAFARAPAARQRRLLASLADSGQQIPIMVVAAEDQAARYVVVDGYQRIAALEQLGLCGG